MRMKWILAGLALLVVAALAARPRRPLPPSAPRPSDPAPAAAAKAAAAPTPEAVAPQPPPAVDLLPALARALREGRDAKELIDALRRRLLPPVADEDNAAPLYLKALELTRRIWADAGPEEQRARNAIFANRALDPKEVEALRGWFARHALAFQEARALLLEAGARPGCRFPPEEVEGISVESRTAVRLQVAGQILAAHAAVTRDPLSLAAELPLSRALRSEPWLVPQLFACAVDATSAIAFRNADFGAPPLAAAVERLDPAGVRQGFERALLGEAFLALQSLDPAAPHGVAAYLEALGDFSKFSNRPYAEIRLDLEALVRQHGAGAPAYANLSSRLIPQLPKLAEQIAQAESSLARIRIAALLQRARAERGALPASLDPAWPADPLTGLPFEYRPEGAGFRLGSGEAAWTYRGAGP